ncbi:hypothetical protein Bbelb_056740 [Branchiostoma belcheri]|nr:hypothetical protein Bbelb_056740 [Branchiostoma belcheri]
MACNALTSENKLNISLQKMNAGRRWELSSARCRPQTRRRSGEVADPEAGSCHSVRRRLCTSCDKSETGRLGAGGILERCADEYRGKRRRRDAGRARVGGIVYRSISDRQPVSFPFIHLPRLDASICPAVYVLTENGWGEQILREIGDL